MGPDGLHRHARVSPLAANELLERGSEVFDRRAAVREALPRRRHGERSRVVDVAVLPCRSEVVHGADFQRAPVAENNAARAAARARQPVLVDRDHDGAERRRVRQRAAVIALRVAVAAVDINARAQEVGGQRRRRHVGDDLAVVRGGAAPTKLTCVALPTS